MNRADHWNIGTLARDSGLVDSGLVDSLCAYPGGGAAVARWHIGRLSSPLTDGENVYKEKVETLFANESTVPKGAAGCRPNPVPANDCSLSSRARRRATLRANRRSKMTADRKQAFLDELRATGSVMAGYRAAGVTRGVAKRAAVRDAEFEAAWVEALNAEAMRLATRVAARYRKTPMGIVYPSQALNPKRYGDTERWRASMTNPDPIAGALFRVRALRSRLRPRRRVPGEPA